MRLLCRLRASGLEQRSFVDLVSELRRACEARATRPLRAQRALQRYLVRVRVGVGVGVGAGVSVRVRVRVGVRV